MDSLFTKIFRFFLNLIRFLQSRTYRKESDKVLNELLDIYSKNHGNNESGFIEFSKANDIRNHLALMNEFKNIQNELFNHIWKIILPDKKLTEQEIYIASEKFCKENYSWIDTTGLKALNRWLIWMCWHEGILKRK